MSTWGFRRSHSLRMDKIKRTFSFRKKKDHVPESSKPHQWQEDERKVREGSCSFQVRYLGCIEVYESRGMQVCEEAVKLLKQNKSKHQRAVLYVSGDALRVVDEIRKGLIVDQTIEKVSFCAPDRGHDKGFAYICRDGTTRRWMCHGFMAVKESVSGERLSHAVGCAFAICLERKQKRDKESGVTVTFNEDKTSFTRTGSFRQTTMTERLQDPQSAIIAEPIPAVNLNMNAAVKRPHATDTMLQKMDSFRGFPKLQNTSSPFKRQMSLPVRGDTAQAHFNLQSISLRANGAGASPIREEVSPASEQADTTIAEMCQEFSAGLSELSGPSNNGFTNRSQQHSAIIHSTSSAQAEIQATFPSPATSSKKTASGCSVYHSNPWGSPEKHQQHQNSFWLQDKTCLPANSAYPSVPVSSDRLLHNAFAPFTNLTSLSPTTRAPQLEAGLQSSSIDSGDIVPNQQRALTLREISKSKRNWQSVSAAQPPIDPFDIAWAERATNQSPAPANTNPFTKENTVTASFKVQL